MTPLLAKAAYGNSDIVEDFHAKVITGRLDYRDGGEAKLEQPS